MNHGDAYMRSFPPEILRVPVVLVATKSGQNTWSQRSVHLARGPPGKKQEVGARIKPTKDFWLGWFKECLQREQGVIVDMFHWVVQRYVLHKL